MNARIIPFPGVAQVDQPEITPEADEFDEWYERNLVPLLADIEEMDRLALEPDHHDFWTYARFIRDALNSWPYPTDQPTED